MLIIWNPPLLTVIIPAAVAGILTYRWPQSVPTAPSIDD